MTTLRSTPRSRARKGSALLAVLWFSAALSAIAFTLSMTVRTELDRAALGIDSTRAYFLAQGALELALKRMMERPAPEEDVPGFLPGQRFMRIPFAAGIVDVEIIGDSGKIDVNRSSPEVLAHLFSASGIDPNVAVGIAGRIVELRRGGLSQTGNSPDLSSFSRSRTSFQELEELLMVPGVTPDILYGSYGLDQDGNLRRVGGLYHYLTLQSSGGIDANYASVEVLRAAGLSPPEIDRIVRIRALRPLEADDVSGLSADTEGFSMGAYSRVSHYNVWATARLNNGRAVRTVGARVLRAPEAGAFGIQIIRWFDTVF